MKSLVLSALTLFLLAASSAIAQDPGVTIVHNSPDPALQVVDVYIKQGDVTNKIEDLTFRSARNVGEVVTLFAGFSTAITIAPGDSEDESVVLAQTVFTPNDGDLYVAAILGVGSTTGYEANPDGKSIGAQIVMVPVAAETQDPTAAGMYFVNGSTDLDKGDMYVRDNATALATGLAYGDYTTTMKELARGLVTFDFTQAGQRNRVLASFAIDLNAVRPITVLVLSGFKTPTANNGSEYSLSALGVGEDGSVIIYDVLSGSQTARIQIIHNSPEPAYAQTDIYVNRVLKGDNLNYRRATGFMDIPAGENIVVGFAPATSASARDYRDSVLLPPLRPGRTYTYLLNGVKDSTKYAANPDTNISVRLTVSVLENALEVGPEEANGTVVRSFHGSTDAPVVSFTRNDLSAPAIATELAYRQATETYLDVPAAIDTLWIVDPADNNKRLKGWQVDLRGNKRALVAIASGFLTPSANQNGPALRIMLVDATGTVTVPQLEVDPGGTSAVQDMVDATAWSVAPVPASESVRVSVRAGADVARFDVLDATGMMVGSWIGVGAGRPMATIPAGSLASGTYLVRASLPDGRLIGTSSIVIAH